MSAGETADVSVGEMLARGAHAIAAGGCETPRLDAEVLLATCLGVGRERLVAGTALAPSEAQLRDFARAVHRRAVEREPVAYIVGRRGFRALELAVDSGALIPRPETELLVECALGLPHGACVLDLGTGSGAVALALKSERDDLELTGSDLSAAALEVARANGRRLGIPVRWVQSDLLEGFADEFDAVVANLPYIAEPERASLAPEILRHAEPPDALYAGPDGLYHIRSALDQIRERPRVEFLALEVGASQGAAVSALVRASGFERVRVQRDLAGSERVVVGEGR